MSESETQAAKAEPKTAFPWRGFYGGKVARIVIDYDDTSSSIIGDAQSLDAMEATQRETVAALTKCLGWLEANVCSLGQPPLTPHGVAELDTIRAALLRAQQDQGKGEG